MVQHIAAAVTVVTATATAVLQPPTMKIEFANCKRINLKDLNEILKFE